MQITIKKPKVTSDYMFVMWIIIKRIFTVTLKGVIYKKTSPSIITDIAWAASISVIVFFMSNGFRYLHSRYRNISICLEWLR